jgi:membrane-associated phospholipid phosphatase
VAVWLALLVVSSSAHAQRVEMPRFGATARQPTAQVTTDVWVAAGFAAGTAALSPLDRALAHVLQDSTRQENVFLQRTATGLRFLGFPGSVIIGTTIYALGLALDDRTVASFGLHGTEAIAASFGAVWVGKNLLGRARPYNDIENPFNFKLARGFEGDRYRSFPSGHSAAAFAVAAALTAEAKIIWPEAHPYAGPVLYTGATMVGISRMYNNKHWASDVAAGAGVGVLTGWALIRYLYSHDTQLDKWLLPGGDAQPAPQAAANRSGPPLMFVWSIPLR